jgi:glutathione S-transferase
MSLKLYFHPLASFCHKALIALYEREIPFEPVIVDLGDEASRAAFRAVWPMAKMPVLRDEARGHTIAESTVIIEYLDAHHFVGARFVPEQARAQLSQAYRVLDREIGSKRWMMGGDFTLADCAAAPALFYANTVVPLGEAQLNLRAYFDRLMARPSVARVLEEAEPYFELFPMEKKPHIARPLGAASR